MYYLFHYCEVSFTTAKSDQRVYVDVYARRRPRSEHQPQQGAAELGPAHLATLPYGMHDIVGNAMAWNHSPSLDEISQ